MLRSLAVVCLLSAASARATPAVLRVALPEGLRCPLPADLLTALQNRFGAERVTEGFAGAGELGLSIAAFPDALELALSESGGQSPTRRRLRLTEGSCADLAETIGLLVDAWLRDLPWHGAGFLPDVPAVPAEVEQAKSVVPPVVPPVVPATPPAVPTAGLALGPLTLRLSGGASIGGDGSALGPDGTLSADETLYRRIGAALFASVLENVSGSQGEGTISASRQTLAIAARYAFVADDQSGLRVYAGVALQAFEAQETGFSIGHSTFEVVPALFLAALWQQHLWGPLSAFAQLAFTGGPETDFQITEGTPPRQVDVLAVSPAWFNLSLGLAGRLF